MSQEQLKGKEILKRDQLEEKAQAAGKFIKH